MEYMEQTNAEAAHPALPAEPLCVYRCCCGEPLDTDALCCGSEKNVSLWFALNTEDVIKLVPPFTCIYSTLSTSLFMPFLT